MRSERLRSRRAAPAGGLRSCVVSVMPSPCRSDAATPIRNDPDPTLILHGVRPGKALRGQTPLGKCYGARRRVGWSVDSARDGRLRRPLPVSRAVLEPVPARSPGEVQGLGARRRLVAADAARADGDLLRRLLEDPRPALPRRRRLRALHAHRPRLLDVRRVRAPERVRVDALEREPDPEGALSAAARPALGCRHAGRRVLGDARRGRLRDRAQAAGKPPLGAARAALRQPPRLPRRRDRARRGSRERALPGRGAPRELPAPAALLPDAGDLSARRARARARGASGLDQGASLGQPAGAGDQHDSRHALRGDRARLGRRDLHRRRRRALAPLRGMGVPPPRRPDRRRALARMRRLDALCCAGLVLLTALALAPLTLLGRIPTSYDTEASYAPYAVFAHSRLVHGHLPLWNPYAFAGQPFAGDTGTGTFYPPWTLALALLSPAHGLAFVLWVHFALAAVGAFLLARAAGGSRFAGLLAGIGFGLSSLLFARV